MADVKVNVYTPAGRHVGYFLNPAIKSFPDGDYELNGEFYDVEGSKVALQIGIQSPDPALFLRCKRPIGRPQKTAKLLCPARPPAGHHERTRRLAPLP